MALVNTGKEMNMKKSGYFGITVRKSISMMLAFVTVCFFSIRINAYESVNNRDEFSMSYMEEDRITEVIHDDYSKTRTFIRCPGVFQHSTITDIEAVGESFDEVKGVLLGLGMNPQEVDGLTLDELIHYSVSPYISVTSSYVVEHPDGTIEYIDEQAMKDALKMIRADMSERSGPARTAAVTGSYSDSYMTVTHTVSAVSGSLGRYYFSTSAQWHTMPFWRIKDSVGSCAQNIAIDPGTQGGYYSYLYSMVSNASTSSGNAQYNITEYQNVINGNWYGSAGLFALPVDYSGGGTTYNCTSLFATYHFYAYVSQPTLPSYFNSVGSYDHAEITFGWSGISINIGGEVSASIGLSFFMGHTRRSAEVIIYHEG